MHDMKTCGSVEVQLHLFLIMAQSLVGRSAWRVYRFTRGEALPGIHWKGGWVGCRNCVDGLYEKNTS
jgi:hypothetical protein